MRVSLWTAFCLTVVFSSVEAATIYIAPDGTGDYPTIQQGIDAALDGDVVMLRAGTYHESTVIQIIEQWPQRSITLTSESGAAATILDFGGWGGISTEGPSVVARQPSRACARTATTTISNLTLINGGTGIYIGISDVAVSGCFIAQCTNGIVLSGDNITISGNTITQSGAGVRGYSGGSVVISDNIVSDNLSCGIEMHAVWGDVVIARNVAFGNTGDWYGGGITVEAGHAVEISYNTVYNNTSYQCGGIHVYNWQVSSLPVVAHNTVVGNAGDAVGGILCETDAAIDNNIVAFSTSGVGIAPYNIYTTVTNCVTYGNAGGDGIGGATDGGGNMIADPTFCGIPGSKNFYLQSDSPCAPGNHPSGELVGAWPVGCSTVSTQPVTWGVLKQMYR